MCVECVRVCMCWSIFVSASVFVGTGRPRWLLVKVPIDLQRFHRGQRGVMWLIGTTVNTETPDRQTDRQTDRRTDAQKVSSAAAYHCIGRDGIIVCVSLYLVQYHNLILSD